MCQGRVISMSLVRLLPWFLHVAWRQGLADDLIYWVNEEVAVMRPGTLDPRGPRRQLLMPTYQSYMLILLDHLMP